MQKVQRVGMPMKTGFASLKDGIRGIILINPVFLIEWFFDKVDNREPNRGR